MFQVQPWQLLREISHLSCGCGGPDASVFQSGEAILKWRQIDDEDLS
jgi:hypothetical protein